jgi:hypothetical protein
VAVGLVEEHELGDVDAGVVEQDREEVHLLLVGFEDRDHQATPGQVASPSRSRRRCSAGEIMGRSGLT